MSVDSSGRAAYAVLQAPALSSKYWQLHVEIRRRRLNTADLLRNYSDSELT